MKQKAPAVVALLVLLSFVSALPTYSQSADVHPDFGSIPPGTSVIGLGTVHPLLNIHPSGASLPGNDVVVISESTNPVAFGANKDGVQNIANACLLPAGFADVGSGTYAPDTKKHEYVFTFASGVSVRKFSLHMADWGDFLPYGGNADKKYAMQMVAYDGNGEVVATDEIAFTSDSTVKNGRPSNEFGSLAVAGDACTAAESQPGNYTFVVEAQGITRVELHARDRASLDPHIGFNDLSFELDVLPVPVDVKPGDFPNVINSKSNGTTAAAFLSTESFDARSVQPWTATLAGAPVLLRKDGRPMAAFEDVNGDGRADLVLHFRTSALPHQNAVVALIGFTSAGSQVGGQDSIIVVP